MQGMTDRPKNRWAVPGAAIALLTAQEARLVSLILGLLLLGLAVRFAHLRSDHSRVLPVASSRERSPAP
jgi:hypothetical protein